MNPVVAVVLGVTLGGEVIGGRAIAGLSVILAGVAVVGIAQMRLRGASGATRDLPVRPGAAPRP